jgi:hypothetical protein
MKHGHLGQKSSVHPEKDGVQINFRLVGPDDVKGSASTPPAANKYDGRDRLRVASDALTEAQTCVIFIWKPTNRFPKDAKQALTRSKPALRLRAGAEVDASPRLSFLISQIHGKVS